MRRSAAPPAWHTGESVHGNWRAKALYTAPAPAEYPRPLRSALLPWRDQRMGPRGQWMAAIAQLLADGVPRSFNRVCVELTGHSSYACRLLAPDAALWELVRTRQVEHTVHEPMLFRAVR